MEIGEAKAIVIEELNRVYNDWRMAAEYKADNPAYVEAIVDMDETHSMVIGYIEMVLSAAQDSAIILH